MTEGTKNTVVGVVLTAFFAVIMAGGVSVLSSQRESERANATIAVHLERIDNVLINQNKILADIHESQNTVPAVVEKALGEVRSRLNMQEYRMSKIEGSTPK